MSNCAPLFRHRVTIALLSLVMGLLVLTRPGARASSVPENGLGAHASSVLENDLSLFSTQQDKNQKPPAPDKQKDETPAPISKDAAKIEDKVAKSNQGPVKLSPVEVVVESCLYLYGGRAALKTARSSIIEQGTIKLATEQGDVTGTYMLRRMNKDKSWEDLLRTDIELDTPEDAQRQGMPPKVKYTLAFNGGSVWAAQDNRYVTPSPESEAAFRSQLTHDYTTLLRYKEDGSKIELGKSETVAGIDTNVVDLTLPNGEKTRFWISTKTYHILHLEYDLSIDPSSPPRRIRIDFYPPFRVAGNTLVQARRVMEEGGKLVQEVNLDSFKYAAKLDPEIFQHLQE